ncbi:ABC transporter ATP-binding protein [Muricoccus radiodurans]|uniref:ABC transporter ATP-binding protein n=1 Tax=Muricoccus radiodurans TaxID=2231721 RepID=UPI003CF1FE2C
MTRTFLAFGTEGTIFDRAATPRAVRPAANLPPQRPLLTFEGVQATWPRAGREAAWLDLSVMTGEVLTLLGPAGAGKTTALTVAAGFLHPDRGRVLLGDKEINRMLPHRRGFGWVPKPLALFPGMTALENVAFPLEARGVGGSERRDRAVKALATVGLAGQEAARPEALDEAAALRVALARALVFAPPLLLLDDPLAALDAAARSDAIALIRRLTRAGTTSVLHATRDAAVAMAISDRIAVIQAGRIRQAGTPQALYDAPGDDAIAAQFGEVNRLHGRVLSVEDDLCRVALDGGLEAVGAAISALGRAPEPGGRCVLAIRPEHVAVAAMTAAELGEDAVPAQLLDAQFAGDHVRLRLRIENGAELIARRPAGLPLPEPGGAAAVAWDAGAARVYAGGAGEKEPPSGPAG